MSDEELTAAQTIDLIVERLGDWRGERLARIRALTHEALPEVVEEIKWRKATNPLGVPTFESDGILFTGESYKDKVKLTFPKGSRIADPAKLFNAGLTGTRHVIDMPQDHELDEDAFRELVQEAARVNAG